ncbi:soma ferritin isoform X2 [Penaeus vannamei]|uniref:soma ferritin isoform X2 n=1 Tax=Penaeus vannamei TaxID=6689 RepID=UPI00387F7B65
MEHGNSKGWRVRSYHFERDDVALPGFAKFFKEAGDRERDHAHQLMNYQNKRGGGIVLQPIAAPPQQEWGCAVDVVQMALDLKKRINQSFLELHVLSSTKDDPFTCHFIDDHFLIEHVESIKKMGDMVTKLRRVGAAGLGVHLFDQELQ